MRSQPARQASRRAPVAAVEPDERRGWLSYGLAALGISALGLAAAGSFALTTSAQTTENANRARPVTVVTAPSPVVPVEAARSSLSSSQLAAITSFTRRPNLATDDSRSPALRTAVIKEQSAQRAEELAKGADGITRAAQLASSVARQDRLSAADRASALATAKLAEEKLRKAVEARVAASLARQTSQARERRQVNDNRSSPDTSSPNTSRPGPTPSYTATGGRAVSPVPGAVIGAHFGQYGIWARYHTGLDFRAAYGTPIRAVKSGIVLFAGNTGDWAGNHVAIRHADGKTTMYSHMSSMAVGSGQSVQAGQVIGYVGQTGRAFGPHLHFELYPVGVRYGDIYNAIDPQPWLAANGVQTR